MENDLSLLGPSNYLGVFLFWVFVWGVFGGWLSGGSVLGGKTGSLRSASDKFSGARLADHAAARRIGKLGSGRTRSVKFCIHAFFVLVFLLFHWCVCVSILIINNCYFNGLFSNCFSLMVLSGLRFYRFSLLVFK